ncbi:hypothetical protein [uncultured Fibrobacter sp.]|uniref:hypothetical protein n=1 Tax=uncultured Fibrobacter sp. TaxID=261512 RepID=UPI0025E71192|nr:hypothetical protein [uncultured Fibrobacter sp.]
MNIYSTVHRACKFCHQQTIYALPEEKLIEHYHTMGFSRLPEHQEKFVQRHVKPKYDEGCIFMYQVI